jgi:hypothetical protein
MKPYALSYRDFSSKEPIWFYWKSYRTEDGAREAMEWLFRQVDWPKGVLGKIVDRRTNYQSIYAPQ